jgi:tetratricopeptide (TPR) repeat protein
MGSRGIPVVLLALVVGAGCLGLSIGADEWNERGETHHAVGEYGEAIAAFDRAIEIDPRHEGAWRNRGLTLSLLNRSSESEESFVRAIAIDAGDAETYRYQALARNATGDRAGALFSLEKAVAIEPRSRDGAITLVSSLQFQGDLLTLEGRHEEANASYRRAHDVMMSTM